MVINQTITKTDIKDRVTVLRTCIEFGEPHFWNGDSFRGEPIDLWVYKNCENKTLKEIVYIQ